MRGIKGGGLARKGISGLERVVQPQRQGLIQPLHIYSWQLYYYSIYNPTITWIDVSGPQKYHYHYAGRSPNQQARSQVWHKKMAPHFIKTLCRDPILEDRQTVPLEVLLISIQVVQSPKPLNQQRCLELARRGTTIRSSQTPWQQVESHFSTVCRQVRIHIPKD